MYPFLRRINESLGSGYVLFRALEVGFILIGLVSVLALLTLSKSFIASATPEIEHFQLGQS